MTLNSVAYAISILLLIGTGVVIYCTWYLARLRCKKKCEWE